MDSIVEIDTADGNSRTILPAVTNFTGFTEKDKNYVKLDLDLKAMLYPPRYRIFFYAYSLVDIKNWLLDAVRWIYIPPPEFAMSSSPNSLDITAGEKGNIELNVNSNTGSQPTVYLDVPYLPVNIGVEYENGNKTLKMPTYNVAKTTLTFDRYSQSEAWPSYNRHIRKCGFSTSVFQTSI